MHTKPIATETRGTVEYLSQPYEIIDRPLSWQLQGLQQTATGYGRKLTSSRVVRLPDGRERRIYVTQYSNAGTAWIVANGRSFVVVRD